MQTATEAAAQVAAIEKTLSPAQLAAFQQLQQQSQGRRRLQQGPATQSSISQINELNQGAALACAAAAAAATAA